jgi:hypothetical protein
MRLFGLAVATAIAVAPVGVKAADLAPPPPIVGLPDYGVAPPPAVAAPVIVAPAPTTPPQYSGAPFPPAVVAPLPPPFGASGPPLAPPAAAPPYGRAAIAVAAGSQAVHCVPIFIPAPMARPVRNLRPRWLQSTIPVSMGRRSTRVQCALIPVIKPTEEPTASNSLEPGQHIGCWCTV